MTKYHKLTVLTCYGRGGHESQMDRLMTNLYPHLSKNIEVFSVSDAIKKPCWSDEHFFINELRSKYRRNPFLVLSNVATSLKCLCSIRLRSDVKCVISTGPGISLIAAIFFKVFSGAKIIHLETWSRFYSYSFTGYLMYYISDEFYVQNCELISLYPKAKYSGRL